MSIQSNPVVFITLGNGAEIWDMLSNELHEYVDSVGYIQVSADFDDKWVKGEVSRVWREFLEDKQNASDAIRLNYIMSVDDVGLWLPTLRQSMEKYFQTLYPAGVFTDVYCLLDDRDLLDHNTNRRNVMRMLQDELDDKSATGLKVYLLSNLNSQNIFTPVESIPKTIALLTLFKDCQPDVYVTGADASRYNEFFFLENCETRHGRFLTASSIHLSIPQRALKSLIMAELLTFGKDDTTGPSANLFAEPPEVPVQPVKTMEYLYGLAVPEMKRDEKLTRREWVERLFGKRLERILAQVTDISDRTFKNSAEVPLEWETMPLYDLLRCTGQGGAGHVAAINSIARAEDNLRDAEEQCKLWLDETPIFSKGGEPESKRRIAPLHYQDIWPYYLASEYLDKHRDLHDLRKKAIALDIKQKNVSELHQRLEHYLNKVEMAVSSFRKEAKEINEVFEPFAAKAIEYFQQLFKQYAEKHKHELSELSREMTKYLSREEFPAYLTRLDEYIDKNIFKSKYFAKSIMDILQDLVAKNRRGDIPTAIGEWVYKSRHWNIRLKIGYTSLYTETNLYMPSLGAAAVKKHYEERGMGRMNLYADNNADSVAVLYHSGAFNLDDLYYEGIYGGEV